MRWPGWNNAALRMQADMRASWGQPRDVTERVKWRGNEYSRKRGKNDSQ
ncbi:hypothetical protein BURMUCGD1_6582 [Burkholderia multivorans CGD1]|nr:hypothetical protein BURMUCGD1_6582 [Burkholderia multivorans CGD1]